MFAEYEDLFIWTGVAILVVVIGLVINSIGLDMSEDNYSRRNRRNPVFYWVTREVSGVMEAVGGISALLAGAALLFLVPASLLIGSCAGITEGGRAILRASGVEEIVQAPPSRLPDGALRGLQSVRVSGDVGDGRGATVVLYGERRDGVFVPKAYRARFWGVPVEERKYEDGTIPRNGFWSLGLPADRSGLASVEPRNDIRADGRWQEGWTTSGSFTTDETAEVYIVVGDVVHTATIPVALR